MQPLPPPGPGALLPDRTCVPGALSLHLWPGGCLLASVCTSLMAQGGQLSFLRLGAAPECPQSRGCSLSPGGRVRGGLAACSRATSVSLPWLVRFGE